MQHAAKISLRYADGKEYQLTEWEQQAMRRLLQGALNSSVTKADYGCKLQFYDDDRKLLFSVPLSEYHVTGNISNHLGHPFMPRTILAGDYHNTMLNAWWSGVRLRLHLPSLLQLLVEFHMCALSETGILRQFRVLLRRYYHGPEDYAREQKPRLLPASLPAARRGPFSISFTASISGSP